MINLGTQLKRKGHIAASHVVLLKWMLNLSVMMTVTIRKKILQDVKFNIIFFVSNILANFRLNQIDSSRCYSIKFGRKNLFQRIRLLEAHIYCRVTKKPTIYWWKVQPKYQCFPKSKILFSNPTTYMSF